MITETEQQSRLADLREWRDRDVGGVPLLNYELACEEKMRFFLRMRAALAALQDIVINPEDARAIAMNALRADHEANG